MSLITSTRRFLTTGGAREAHVQWIGEKVFTTYGRILGKGWLENTLKPNRFVILMSGRSGSTFFCDFLDSHPKIRCQSELLILERKDVHPFLCGLAAYYGRRGITWGFKVKIDHLLKQQQMDPRGFFEEMKRVGFRFLHLVRNDTVRQVVSAHVGFLRNNYHTRSKEKVKVNTQYVIDSIKAAEDRKNVERKIMAEFEHLAISYENDIFSETSHQHLAKKCCNFLDLKHLQMNSQFGKVNTDSIWDCIDNSSELITRLKSAGMLVA